jgi:hypothetical protein
MLWQLGMLQCQQLPTRRPVAGHIPSSSSCVASVKRHSSSNPTNRDSRSSTGNSSSRCCCCRSSTVCMQVLQLHHMLTPCCISRGRCTLLGACPLVGLLRQLKKRLLLLLCWAA